jgi:carbon monoxide dehydrogenase subunit G
MKISGSYVFNAPAREVWTVLMDPQALARCVPGCEGVTETGLGCYRAALSGSVGPFQGRYQLEVTLADLEPPRSYRMTLEGIGSGVSTSGEAQITLEEHGGQTTVRMTGDAEAGGIMGRMAQQLAGGKVQTMLDGFFSCLQESVGQPGPPG